MAQSKITTGTQAFKRADRRVKDSARWLLEFASINIDELSAQRSTELAAEMIAVTKREADEYLKTGVFDPFLNSPDMVKGSMMGRFQDWLKNQLKEAQAGKWQLYDPNLMPHRTIDLFHVRANDRTGDTFVMEPLDVFAMSVNRIVERERDRFGICLNPRCRKPFVAERKGRGKYCSQRCASYVHVMKSRGKPVV